MDFTNTWSLIMICEICKENLEIVWNIENSVIPNVYRNTVTTDFKISSQTTYHCAKCNYAKNVHDFSLNDIFCGYTYRSPLTNLDDAVATKISNFCVKKNIKKIVEIGGNNGVFANKIVSHMPELRDYTIYDKVPLEAHSRILTHKEEFLSSTTQNYKADFVITRHAFAHNESILKFARNIVEKFSPEHIYVECADWILTHSNKDFGQLYSEHYYCLSALSVYKLFASYGYGVADIDSFNIHNGSFGLFLSKGSSGKIKNMSYSNSAIHDDIVKWKENICRIWNNANDRPIIIWGSSAKIVFIINALGLSTRYVKRIHDTTNAKCELFPPGIDVCISPEQEDVVDYGSYSVIVGAKNFSSILVPKIKKKYPKSEIIFI